jgi:hypothetical protein
MLLFTDKVRAVLNQLHCRKPSVQWFWQMIGKNSVRVAVAFGFFIYAVVLGCWRSAPPLKWTGQDTKFKDTLEHRRTPVESSKGGGELHDDRPR